MSVDEYGDLCELAYRDGYTDALAEILESREVAGRYRRAYDALVVERRRLRRRVSVLAAWAMLATAALLWGIALEALRD